MNSRKALGRGLSSLIPISPTPLPPTRIGSPSEETGFIKISIDKIRPNHLQPRRHFDPESLSELATSIKQHGLAQPIVVSYDTLSRSYELIAGERRWRAAQLSGMTEIDAVVRQPRDDQHRLALTLIENLQRADLNPIEVAFGYLRLMKEFHIKQSELAREVGKSAAAISNTLRLLDLPEEIQKALQFTTITEGHGRALLMLTDPNSRHTVFKKILEDGLSVRETEELARQIDAGLTISTEPTPVRKATSKSADLRAIESSLQQTLGTKVVIKTRQDPSKGSIQIHFFSFEDFDRILKAIKK
ncbi:MAG: ParB/RepB/Spo0J family partition protein [Elusimicrobiota bacterium]